MSSKDIIRKELIKKRDSLSDSDVLDMSLIITDKFFKKYSYLDVFLLYYPFGKEVNTINLIEKLHNMGKQIYLPVVTGKEMVFRKFTSFDSLKQGKYGIYEPDGELLASKPDIMCMPGVVFDNDCNRIGYGGGFYDKYLSHNNAYIKSAVAYDFQIIDKIETESFDIPVDEIFTDKRVISRRI